jgi:phage terminase large subunit-like protein
MTKSNVSLALEAMRRIERQKLTLCYDSRDLDSRPSPKQQEFLNDIGKIRIRYIVSANQVGKSSAGCREMAWILERNHPTWVRPKEWGAGPLLMIIVGQSRSLVSKELWERKIKPLLTDKESWKERTISGHVQSVVNTKTGDEVVFLVHGSGSDEMRKQLQGYRAHYVLLDEMPADYDAFTELLFRTDAYGGYMTVAFTPLIRNIELQNAVENAVAPLSRKYKWSVWDNPENLKPEKRKSIEQAMALMSESARRTRYFGEWSSADDTVFYVDAEKLLVDAPLGYTPGWRHVEVVDPAGTGVTGLTYWAQDPSTNVWHCVIAEYIRGGQDNSPRMLVDKVYKRGMGLNIVRRIADTMPWFYITAKEMYNLTYMRPFNKVQRKEDLIKNLQEALSSGRILIFKQAKLLLEELMSMRYNDSGKIVQHQHFHVCDCAQYFWDLRPPDTHVVENISRDMWIMREHEKGKHKEAVAQLNTKRVVRHRGRLRPRF